eukprot:1794552-Heterocapsa_arctica.AAC.1
MAALMTSDDDDDDDNGDNGDNDHDDDNGDNGDNDHDDDNEEETPGPGEAHAVHVFCDTAAIPRQVDHHVYYAGGSLNDMK